jgi:hypothetical protein
MNEIHPMSCVFLFLDTPLDYCQAIVFSTSPVSFPWSSPHSAVDTGGCDVRGPGKVKFSPGSRTSVILVDETTEWCDACGKISLPRVPPRFFKIVAGSENNLSANKFQNLSGTITAVVLLVWKLDRK